VVDIDRHRAVRLPWVDGAGERQTTTLKPADVVAGDVAVSYLETDAVQGATAGTVHLLRAGPWTSAVAVIDPGANAAARPRPLVPGPPEELARLTALPAVERDAAVVAAYGCRLQGAGMNETEDRRLLMQQWPEPAVGVEVFVSAVRAPARVLPADEGVGKAASRVTVGPT